MQIELRKRIITAAEIAGAAAVSAAALYIALQRAPEAAALVLLAFIITIFFFILGPVFAFFFYFMTTFFQTIPVPGLALSGNQIAGFFFIFAWLHWLSRKKVTLPRGGFFHFLIFVVIYFSFSALSGDDFKAGAQHFFYLVLYLVLAIVVSSIIRDERSLKKILWIMLIVTGLSSLMGLAEFVTQHDLLAKTSAYWHGYLRINGTAPNSIVFAYNSIYAFPLGYYLFSESKTARLRLLAIALALFINVVGLLTFNRQTIVYVAVQLMVMPILFRNRYNRVFLLTIGFVLIFVAPFVVPPLARRLETILQEKKDYSVTIRHDNLLVGLEIVKKKPLLGIGFGSFPTSWQKYLPGTTYNLQFDRESKHYPDFGYNQLLSETGIIGFAIAIILFMTIVVIAWRIRRTSLREGNHARANFASIILGMMSTFLLANFIQDTFLYIRTWIMFGLMLALTRGEFDATPTHKETNS
jgi:O-antigen ligase